MACNLDWMSCPFALGHYIWYEVVTDVIDCLVNETILWKISAIILYCAIVFYFINWKIRWMKELDKSVENLSEVNSKIKDLELKVNILTYKAQYGTWPLLRLANKINSNNFKTVQSFNSQLNDESWIQYILTSTRSKKCDKRNELLCDPESQLRKGDFNTLDTEYIFSEFEDTPIHKLIREKSLQKNIEKDQQNDVYCNSQSEINNINKTLKNNLKVMNSSEKLIINTAEFSDESSTNNHDDLKHFILGTKKNVNKNSKLLELESQLESFNTALIETKTFDHELVGHESSTVLFSNIIMPNLMKKNAKDVGENTKIEYEEKNDQFNIFDAKPKNLEGSEEKRKKNPYHEMGADESKNNSTLHSYLELQNIGDVSEHLKQYEIDVTDKDEKIEQQITELISKSDLSLNHLTNSSSDKSVDKLIDQLIENERKCKFEKYLLNSNPKENILENSINNISSSSNFLQDPQSKTEICDDFLNEIKMFQEDKLIHSSCQINNENEGLIDIKSLDIKGSESSDSKFFDNTSNENNHNFNFQDNENLNHLLFEHNLKEFSYTNINENDIDDNGIQCDNIYTDDSIYRDNVEFEQINDNIDSRDFRCDNKTYLQNYERKIKDTVKNNWNCGDSNSSVIQSNTIAMASNKPKNLIRNNIHQTSTITNSEQVFHKIDNNSDTRHRLSIKNNLDLISNKCLKTKSNLNLTTIEKINPILSCKRSKSYVAANEMNFHIPSKLYQNPHVIKKSIITINII